RGSRRAARPAASTRTACGAAVLTGMRKRPLASVRAVSAGSAGPNSSADCTDTSAPVTGLPSGPTTLPSTTGAAAGDGEGPGDGEAARDGDAATDGGGVARGDDATAGACASAEGAPDRPAATAANTPTQRSGARRRCGPMAPPALLGTA